MFLAKLEAMIIEGYIESPLIHPQTSLNGTF